MVILGVIFSPCPGPALKDLTDREEYGLLKPSFWHVEERTSDFSGRNAVERGRKEAICTCDVRGGGVSGGKWRREKLRVNPGERSTRIAYAHQEDLSDL